MAKILLSTTRTLKPNYLIERQPFFVRAPGCGLENNPLERVLDFPNVDNRARSYLQGNSSSHHSPVTAVLASHRGTWHQSCSRHRPGNPRHTRFCIQDALMPPFASRALSGSLTYCNSEATVSLPRSRVQGFPQGFRVGQQVLTGFTL